MGHSQSYDLRNPEATDEKGDSVRGVRRISKEHETNTKFYDQDSFDYREDQLRERIRNEQLKKREDELETLRIKQHETKEPIIDAYRQTSPQPTYKEFNHYDSLKHHSPVDPTTYHKLHRRKDVEKTEFVAVTGSQPTKVRVIEQTPIITKPVISKEPKHPIGYPQHYVHRGQLSPLTRHQEVPEYEFVPVKDFTPRQNYYDTVDDFAEEQPATIEKIIPVNAPTPVNAAPRTRIPVGYPIYYEYSGRVSPLPRHQEVPQSQFVPYEEVRFRTPPQHHHQYDTVDELAQTDDEEEEIQVIPVVTTKKVPEGYPTHYVYSGRTSPLPRHPEVEPSPMPRYIPPMTIPHSSPPPMYDYTPDEEESRFIPYQHSRNPSSGFTSISEIRAEKRMVVGVDTFEEDPPTPNKIVISVARNPDFPTYSAKMRQSSPSFEVEQENLYRQREEPEVPHFIRPSQTGYEVLKKKNVPNHQNPTPIVTNNNNNIIEKKVYIPIERKPETRSQQTQYQPPSETCNVPYCTHVHVPDEPIVLVGREGNAPHKAIRTYEEDRLSTPVNESDLDNVIDLAREDEIGPMTTQQQRRGVVQEEKLFYQPHLPTLSLHRRPVVGFYDKLH